jgi:hypothetical protein
MRRYYGRLPDGTQPQSISPERRLGWQFALRFFQLTLIGAGAVSLDRHARRSPRHGCCTH